MEPVADESPRTGRRGPLRFFTMRAASPHDSVPSPSLADMEAARIGLQQRLRARPRLWLFDAAGATLQRLPLIPAVARATASVLRRDTRAEP